MMWFTETPWPPIVICLSLAVLLFVVFLSQRRGGFLAGALLCAGLCGVVFVVEQQIVTEREVVEQRLVDLVKTFARESREIGAANVLAAGPEPHSLSYISAGAKDVRGMVRAALQLVDVENDVRVSDVRTTLTNNDSLAVVQFRASATLRQYGHHPSRWELNWQRENNEWKVTRVQRLNFMSGELLQNPLQDRE